MNWNEPQMTGQPLYRIAFSGGNVVERRADNIEQAVEIAKLRQLESGKTAELTGNATQWSFEKQQWEHVNLIANAAINKALGNAANQEVSDDK